MDEDGGELFSKGNACNDGDEDHTPYPAGMEIGRKFP
jgi:hypothetical protein